MVSKVANKLNPELVASLQGEKIVSLVTIDRETKQPQLTSISWVLASEDGTQIKFAVGHKSSSALNIMENNHVTIGMIGANSYYSVKGTGTVSDVIERTMKYQIVTVQVEAVEDVIFYGGRITVEPAYEKTYNADLAKKLDAEVYELLRS